MDGGDVAGGTTVSLAENGDTAFADSAGNFTLAEPAATYTVTVAQAGYAPQTLPPFSPARRTGDVGGRLALVAVRVGGVRRWWSTSRWVSVALGPSSVGSRPGGAMPARR
jgi:hypothetical protein